jgi:hypothetical protein
MEKMALEKHAEILSMLTTGYNYCSIKLAVDSYLLGYFNSDSTPTSRIAEIDQVFKMIATMQQAGQPGEVIAMRLHDALLTGLRYGNWSTY